MKLDLILENVRNKYNLGLLEESESLDEKQLLQAKILINESTMNIRAMLVDEGVIESTKDMLQESWVDAMIEEMAVHSNHPQLDKRNYQTGQNRDILAGAIKQTRAYGQANDAGRGEYLNNAAAKSQTGDPYATYKNSAEFKKTRTLMKPRGNDALFQKGLGIGGSQRLVKVANR